ncbi:peptide ABC transporter [Martelella alba]|uniref:Peptide ABC transporter n=1 Tax=Martelella alba TaxID=2590451 RepID=A0A506UDA1_9HYPH|nr:M55 family metallopeptidase [Martelella alba]TPW31578.1 peptide ABC transporter [Martelella alba]
MKVFLSADIEGTAGITMWDEARKHIPGEYAEFQKFMTAEVIAACEGAREAGADEVLIKDAHATARNILLGDLPDYVRIIRGWSGHPDQMMFGISADCDVAIYTGYHSKAGDETNPLAHTSNLRISRVLLNGEVASELSLNARCAALYGVPSAFLSGDQGICDDAGAMMPGIVTVATSEGIGPATNSLSPVKARALIFDGVKKALSGDFSACLPPKADDYELVIEFNNPVDAYKASWYPGAVSNAPRSVSFWHRNFFEILRAYQFMKL